MGDWEGTWTLEQYIISLFERGMTNSNEFKAMLYIYGREKLAAIWKKHCQNLKEKKQERS